MSKNNDDHQKLVAIGSGITEVKFLIDNREETFSRINENEETLFPNIFIPNRLPSGCGAKAPIYHPDELKVFLGSILHSCGLPNDLRPVLWKGKNKWVELPCEIKAAIEGAHSTDLPKHEQDKHWDDWQSWWRAYCLSKRNESHAICSVYQATKEDDYVLSDSSGGYAARLLDMLPNQLTLNRIISGKFFSAETEVLHLFQRGISFGMVYAEASLKFQWEKYALVGKKTVDGGKRGSQIHHGSSIERSEKYAMYQSELENICKANPKLGITKAREMIAKKHNVSSKQIQRHTYNPKKNLDSPPLAQK